MWQLALLVCACHSVTLNAWHEKQAISRFSTNTACIFISTWHFTPFLSCRWKCQPGVPIGYERVLFPQISFNNSWPWKWDLNFEELSGNEIEYKSRNSAEPPGWSRRWIMEICLSRSPIHIQQEDSFSFSPLDLQRLRWGMFSTKETRFFCVNPRGKRFYAKVHVGDDELVYSSTFYAFLRLSLPKIVEANFWIESNLFAGINTKWKWSTQVVSRLGYSPSCNRYQLT